MAISIEPKDYVVCSYQGKGDLKPRIYVLKVYSVDTKEVSGRHEAKDVHRNPVTLTFPRSSVVCNLGRKPHPGKVYGFDTDARFRGSVDLHQEYPTFHVYAGDVSPSARESLISALDLVSKKLKKLGLSFLLEGDDTEWIIHPKRGKYAGYYAHSSHPEVKPHLISISLPTGDENGDPSTSTAFAYVVAHELGHKLHFQHYTASQFPKGNSTWLKLYLSSVPSSFVSAEDRKRILKEVSAQPSLNSWHKVSGVDEDHTRMKVILRDLLQTSSLRPRDVNTLLSAGDVEGLRAVWPLLPTGKSVPSPILTEYATRNVHELFAEAFAYYILGRKMPESVSNRMANTITSLNKRR